MDRFVKTLPTTWLKGPCYIDDVASVCALDVNMEHVDLPVCCLRQIAAHCDLRTIMNLQRTCRDSADLFLLNVQMQGFVAIQISKELGALYGKDWKEFHRTQRRGAYWQLWTHRYVGSIRARDVADAEAILAEITEKLADSDPE